MTVIGRRTFLGGLGAALALPLLPSLKARAQAAAAPRRFVAFFTPNGIRNGGSWADGSGPDFTFGDILRPLEPFREKLLLLDGLDMSYGGPGGGHQQGIGALLTGHELQEGDFVGGGGDTSAGFANGISIDQHLAASLPQETQFPSLALGVQVEGANNRHRLSMRGAGDPLVPLDDPYSLFDLVFAPMLGSVADRARRTRRRRSVIDHVRGDLGRLRGRLGSTERVRLDAHLSALDEVERGLGIGPGGGAACVPPALEERDRLDQPENYQWVGERQMDLLHMALTCDLTRYATILWGGATSSHRFNFMDPPIQDTHHQLTHDDRDRTEDDVARINGWYAERFAYLLDKLESTPEGDDGGTMLDNTLVLWGSDLADGYTHSRQGMQFVLAGNVGGVLSTGRFLHYQSRHHVDLLVTICQAFGLADDTFGKASLNQGPLENLFA